MKSLFDILEKSKDSDKIAIIQDNGEKVTYAQLYMSSIYMARKLGDSSQNILVYSSNKIDFVISIFACWFVNKTVIPIGMHLSVNEINNLVEFCEIDTVLIEKNINVDELNINNKVYVEPIIMEQIDIDNMVKNESIKDSSVLICPTTGTTSKSKLVMLSADNILNEISNIKYAYDYNENTIELIAVPLSSITGLIGLLLVILFANGTVVLYSGKFSPMKISRVIKENSINSIFFTSSLLLGMIKYTSINLNDFSTVKKIVIGGEMVSKEFISKIPEKLTGCEVFPAYGLTEAGSLVSTFDKNRSNPIDSVGRVIPSFRIKILNSYGEECVNGEDGEIVISGPSIMLGYYKNIESTKEVLVDNWLRTGDIGSIDKDGFLYIKGRKKNIAIINGINVHFEEVEEYILKHNAIRQVCVYSENNNITGELLVADIVLKDGYELTSKEIIKFCKQGLSIFKIPRKINIVANIQLNSCGKLRRR